MNKLIAALVISLGLVCAALGQVVTVAPFPQGGQPNNVTDAATGTTGQITAAIAGVSGRWSYLCGFVATSVGTVSAIAVNLTVTGIPTALSMQYAYVSSGQGILGIAFPGCIASKAQASAITVTLPGGGTGTVNALDVWGYTN